MPKTQGEFLEDPDTRKRRRRLCMLFGAYHDRSGTDKHRARVLKEMKLVVRTADDWIALQEARLAHTAVMEGQQRGMSADRATTVRTALARAATQKKQAQQPPVQPAAAKRPLTKAERKARRKATKRRKVKLVQPSSRGRRQSSRQGMFNVYAMPVRSITTNNVGRGKGAR